MDMLDPAYHGDALDKNIFLPFPYSIYVRDDFR